MNGLTIVEYDDTLAGEFHDINAEWIAAMFVLEPHDRAVLENPRKYIIDAGGTILFAATEALGIVGTCALMPSGDGHLELTKMGVRETARGLKAGEFLLAAAIERAQSITPGDLYLLTNHTCEAAIHLYEKRGFVHSADIMARYGSTYARCDVAMKWHPPHS